jgi:uncharacterized protein
VNIYSFSKKGAESVGLGMQKKDAELEYWERRFVAHFESGPAQTDGSHDLGHFQRVWKAARYINLEEGGPADPLILLAAAYFHDLVSFPKNHPQRSESSRVSGERAAELLRTAVFAGGLKKGNTEGLGEEGGGFPAEKIEGVRHAIHAHSFSARIEPLTIEAKILQDADRLEAVGAIGLARVFYTAGQLGQTLFHPEDPLAEGREPDDRLYSLDHFKVKLLKLPALMNTATGRRMAESNAAYLEEFLEKIRAEILGMETI